MAGVSVTLVGSWLLIMLGLLARAGAAFSMGGVMPQVLARINARNIVWCFVYIAFGFLPYQP